MVMLMVTLIASLVAILYVSEMIAAYHAAGRNWSRMAVDVRLVYLVTEPIFQAGVRVLLFVDRLFYRPDRENNRAPSGQFAPR